MLLRCHQNRATIRCLDKKVIPTQISIETTRKKDGSKIVLDINKWYIIAIAIVVIVLVIH